MEGNVENKTTKKNRKVLFGILGGLLLIIILLLLLFKSCMKESPMKESLAKRNPAEAFYDINKKHGFVEFSSKKGDTPYGDVQRFEYWFSGDNYRITWYNKDQSVRLHMISPDGKTLYHSSPEKKTSVIAYVGPQFHQWIFQGPEGFNPGEAATEGEFQVYTFVAKKLWNIEGASQQFYLEDIKLYTKDGEVVKILTRTNSKLVEEKDLVTSQYVLVDTDNKITYNKELFELPYEIVKVVKE